jgi:hypothetical protein
MRNILVGAMLLMAGACETIGFYGQAMSGQLAILRAKQPSEALIASPSTDAALRAQLQQVDSLLKFARRTSLDPKRRYSSYARIDRKYVLWNVFATPSSPLIRSGGAIRSRVAPHIEGISVRAAPNGMLDSLDCSGVTRSLAAWLPVHARLVRRPCTVDLRQLARCGSRRPDLS